MCEDGAQALLHRGPRLERGVGRVALAAGEPGGERHQPPRRPHAQLDGAPGGDLGRDGAVHQAREQRAALAQAEDPLLMRPRRDDRDQSRGTLEHRALGQVEVARGGDPHEARPLQPAVGRDGHRAGRPGGGGSGRRWAAGGMERRAVRQDQRDRGADVRGGDLDDGVDPLAGLEEAGQAALHRLGAPEGGELAVDDAPMDLLGHGHEPHRAVQGHEREPGLRGGADGGRRDAGQVGAELDDHARDVLACRARGSSGPPRGGPRAC